MTLQQFENWLNKLKNIWEKQKPGEISNLCADKFFWHETPFTKPYTVKEQLEKDWQGILDQKDISMSYEILSVNENTGIANWKAVFTKLPSGEKVVMDGIFKVMLNGQGKCVEFRQWFNYEK